MLTQENLAYSQGYQVVCGCDEAGAGPLAGPVVGAAVILPPDFQLEQLPFLNDSKKLSEKRREGLYPMIQEIALAYGVAFVSAEEIDQTDILSARMKVMQLAINQLKISPDFALIDGNRDKGKSFSITTPHTLLVGGDGISASIACASILAKVSRDRYMVEQSARYPVYQFEKHKGYGTKLHYETIKTHGVCPLHRATFLAKKAEELGL